MSSGQSRLRSMRSALRAAAPWCSPSFAFCFGRLLVDVLEDAVERAVVVDELGGGLLADPGTPARLSLESPRNAAYST